jgi:hypothetical protein
MEKERNPAFRKLLQDGAETLDISRGKLLAVEGQLSDSPHFPGEGPF